MESRIENQRFELSFSKRGMRNNRLTVIWFTIIIVALFCYAGITSTAGWFCFTLALIIALTAAYSISYMIRLPRESYMEITSDNILRCVYKGRRKIEYPIKEIISIEEATLEEAERKYATLPVVLNSKGDELYPARGVMITFNRAYIKSVFPVYFNPADISGFISEIRLRIETGARYDL